MSCNMGRPRRGYEQHSQRSRSDRAEVPEALKSRGEMRPFKAVKPSRRRPVGAYSVLGVQMGASASAITAAYKQLALGQIGERLSSST